MSDNILQYSSYLIDLSNTLLEHRDGLTEHQAEIMDTIHRRSEQFQNDFLARYNTSIKKLASYLNHDALTPLTVIIGYSEMLLLEAAGPLEGDYREAVEYLRDCSYALHEEVVELQKIMVELRAQLTSEV